jgi:transcription termination factor NusB
LFATQLKRDEPLPSVKEKLRVLDAALVALERPGLSIAEITRLNKIILGVKVYQQLFADFVNYRALESEVVELRKQLASEKNQS